jgi:hypothetical protein
MENKFGPPGGKWQEWAQSVWHSMIPLAVFRDAGKGSFEQRIANYRHNRAQRQILPYYIAKWTAFAAGMLVLIQLFSELMLATPAGSVDHLCATLACMSIGIGFALACVVIAVLFASYLYLTWVVR